MRIFSKSIENLELLDVGEVMEAVNNVVPDNSSLIAGYAMPSDTYIDLTLGASYTTYTSPADGYVSASGTIVSSGFVVLQSSGVYSISQHTGGNYVTIPVSKGQQFSCGYAGITIDRFIFTYTVGSESEAQ